MTSKPVLTHYDSNLACDSTPYGVDVVLAHVLPTGEEEPMAYISRTLSKAEQNYAQVEKEALAIVYGINNFHQYVHIFKKVYLGDRLELYQ